MSSQPADPTDTVSTVTFNLVDDAPKFLTGAFIEREQGGTIAIGVMKQNGAYAYTRITLDQFRAACAIVDPE